MLDRNIVDEVLRTAVHQGGDFAELFLEDTLCHSMRLRSRVIEQAGTDRLHGAGIRILNGTTAVYVYTNDTTREGLLRCANQASDAIRSTGSCTPAAFRCTDYRRPEEILLPPCDVKAAIKAEKLRAADAAARGVSNEIIQVVVNYLDKTQNVLIANTDGVFATDERVYTRMSTTCVASDGKEIQRGFIGPGGLLGFEAFDARIRPEEDAIKAARSAITSLHAPMCPGGIMPVVVGNGFGGVIFHEACGHSLEATSVAPGFSEFSGKLGQVIAAPCVSAVDDGTLTNEWGSLHVDDEGTPTTCLQLIKDGVLTNYMVDILGGRKMGMAPTGSGRRQSYAFAPTSRMRNTYIAAGTDDDDEMIRTMGNGLYATSMGGGSVNPVTGEFNFSVNEGWLVKDGKIDHPVRGATLIGRGSEVLMKIDRVGRNMTMAQGMCGSVSGSVPTNVGQPQIRISSITVGGSEERG